MVRREIKLMDEEVETLQASPGEQSGASRGITSISGVWCAAVMKSPFALGSPADDPRAELGAPFIAHADG